MSRVKTVEEYIAHAPEEVRPKLAQIRKIITAAAPKAEEKISYAMPYYGYKGRLAYFSFTKSHIGLYVMPPVIQDHKKELERYSTATATVRFPLDEELPVILIEKLVKAGVQNNETRASKK
jgi:uncharacterized protein YdhG (YjbR/CyaY superfamily)